MLPGNGLVGTAFSELVKKWIFHNKYNLSNPLNSSFHIKTFSEVAI